MSQAVIISYDLNNAPSEEYEALAEYIEGIGDGWCKPLESVYFVVTNMDLNDINEGIKAVLTNQEGKIRFGTRWIVAPTELKNAAGHVSLETLKWWKETENLGF